MEARVAAGDPKGAARDLAALSKQHPGDVALLARLADTRGWAP
ncbi:MAG: hypothetical protein ACE5EF_05320 [Dehalococcoidia bacterium]